MCVGIIGAALVLAFPRWPAGRARLSVGFAAAGAAAVGGIGLLLEHLDERTDRSTAHLVAGDHARVQMLPDTPTEAVLELARMIAHPDYASCSLLDEAAQNAFAAYRAADCAAALWSAHHGVTDPGRYGRIDPDSLRFRPLANGMVDVDACTVTWRPSLDQILNGADAAAPQPGPPPGRITVTPAAAAAWRIIDYRSC